MIRPIFILAVLVVGTVSGHFGYLHFAAPRAPAAVPTSARPELTWLQRELDLTPSELPAVNALHADHWTRVPRLRAQLEAERRNSQVTGNPTTCVAMEAQCKDDTVSFIQQVTAVLRPQQRQKYLGLVGSCLPRAKRTEGGIVEQSSGR